jgi:hypothetical protein
MCMVVFAASDEPMPTIPPDDSFLFQAQPLLAGSEPVQRLFSKPHVYDLTSVGGCACGFGYGPYDLEVLADADVPAEVKEAAVANHKASRDSIRLLREYLRLATGTGTAEVYSCWSGDEGLEPETRLDVSLEHFDGDEFNFVERQFLTVSGE